MHVKDVLDNLDIRIKLPQHWYSTDVSNEFEYGELVENDGIIKIRAEGENNTKFIVIDVDALGDVHPELAGVKMTLINPTIEVVEDGKKCTSEEGCLSVPGIHESVTRIEKVHMHWYDENFNEHDEVIEGYLARVIQHEYDHLMGKVFIDHISPIRKQLIKAKVGNIIKGKVNCGYRVKGAGTK